MNADETLTAEDAEEKKNFTAKDAKGSKNKILNHKRHEGRTIFTAKAPRRQERQN